MRVSEDNAEPDWWSHIRQRTIELATQRGVPMQHFTKHDLRRVEDILTDPGEDRPGDQGARIAVGRTDGGRYLRVIYVPDPEPDSAFVITAYTLEGKALTAYKRRRRKKK